MENIQVNYAKPTDTERAELRDTLARLRYTVQNAEKEKSDFDRLHDFIRSNSSNDVDYEIRLRELTNVKISQKAYDSLSAFIIKTCNERYLRESEERK